MYKTNGTWFIYGITSFCDSTIDGQYCNNTLPSYFTKVTNYLEWMKSYNVFHVPSIIINNNDIVYFTNFSKYATSSLYYRITNSSTRKLLYCSENLFILIVLFAKFFICIIIY